MSDIVKMSGIVACLNQYDKVCQEMDTDGHPYITKMLEIEKTASAM
jgi:hypothetical protein